MKLYGFRPKSEEEREKIERAMEEGRYPSIDAFIREAVLAYLHPTTAGPATVALRDAIDSLKEAQDEIEQRLTKVT